MRELYNEEVLDLLELVKLLQHPEHYGCTIDRGQNPEASRIIDAAIADILGLQRRPYPVGPGAWLAPRP